MQAGAGIVADSNPTGRVQETQDKAKALIRALELAQEGCEREEREASSRGPWRGAST